MLCYFLTFITFSIRHSFNNPLIYNFQSSKIARSASKRKVLSLEKKFERSILKETREHVAVLNNRHKKNPH
jgi:hypothetical protein